MYFDMKKLVDNVELMKVIVQNQSFLSGNSDGKMMEVDLLSNSIISNFQLSEYSLNGCYINFSTMKLCSFYSIDFGQGSLSSSVFENIIFFECSFVKSEVIETEFRNCLFLNCNFTRTQIISSNIVNCVFSSSNLNKCTISNSNLDNIIFSCLMNNIILIENTENQVIWSNIET